MGFLFSILYAPVVFYALRHYDVKSVALMIFVTTFVWFLSLKEKRNFMAMFPLFYMFVGVTAYFSEAFLVIKLLPLFLSIFFTLTLLISYLKKESLILYFAKKFSKVEIDEVEEQYIHRSTLFWFAVGVLNVLAHLTVFFSSNLSIWVYYSSFGWYFLFIVAGVIQFLHRHFIFLRRRNV